MSNLHYNRYYKSPAIIEKYNLSFHNYILVFSEDSIVKIGILNKKFEFKVVGIGKFKYEKNIITFVIQKANDEYKSYWKGKICQEGIEFKIKNADFEDVEGLYRLI